jgi:5-methylcytosine-specific restriction protein B
VFKAVADWLVGYEERQPELVRFLKEVGIDKGFEDKDESKATIPLREIDPFTFYCMFTRYGRARPSSSRTRSSAPWISSVPASRN